MLNLNYIKDKIRGKNVRVIFADGNDARLPKAVRILIDEALVQPVVVFNSRKSQMAEHYPKETILIDCADSKEASKWSQKIVAKDSKQDLAKLIDDFDDPLKASAIILNAGGADALVAGLIFSTRDVLRVALKQIGLKKDAKLASSYFLIELEKTRTESNFLALADCAMNIDPDSEQLAQIAIDTAENSRKILDWEPRITMLSFSSLGSAESPSTKKVVQATHIAQIKQPSLNITGEIQLDSAINPEIAKQKSTQSQELKGDANVLIFPNLDAGNIGYKILEQFTNSHAYGPILQGFAKNISDLSRGSSVQDIVGTASIVASLALADKQNKTKKDA